jgi:hypothetical protein
MTPLARRELNPNQPLIRRPLSPLSYEPVRAAGVEPAASAMSRRHSAGELRAQTLSGPAEIRTPIAAMPSRRPSIGRPARAPAWSRTTISCSSGRRSYRMSYRGNRASDENRTRPLCLDRAAFPPGNLGGNWGDRRVSIPDLLVHSQPCRAATPRPPRSSASRESNPHQPVIGRPHCHCARGGCCDCRSGRN